MSGLQNAGKSGTRVIVLDLSDAAEFLGRIEERFESIDQKLELLTKTDDQLLTRAEVAAMFDVHVITVTRWVREGHLVSVKLKGQPRFRRGDVITAIRQNRHGNSKLSEDAVNEKQAATA